MLYASCNAVCLSGHKFITQFDLVKKKTGSDE